MPSKPPPPPKPIPNKKHTLTLKTDKKTSSFGLTVRGTTVSGEAHVFVTSVESDGANVKSGLKVGDEFIKVAGVDVAGNYKLCMSTLAGKIQINIKSHPIGTNVIDR